MGAADVPRRPKVVGVMRAGCRRRDLTLHVPPCYLPGNVSGPLGLASTLATTGQRHVHWPVAVLLRGKKKKAPDH